ncbi:acyl carrier protein [Streptomyces sp. NBC_01549]|uniref:acyl carrier protein n=1 Tax=Streptomyces sp. NBC_01549 TaxID=2975874 RepID=UPI0022505FD0|nr:acyl carrier protein [Streptomyces sp. NBC_01549]MCX4591795.1 acyl carrier protein [Streptomyces sp. NBC_01549]
MTMQQFTFEDLKRILLAGAGAEEGVDLDGEILDTSFEDLGYESLALLETGSRIERQYGITLDDDALTDSPTPRSLIEAVNARLAVSTSTAA